MLSILNIGIDRSLLMAGSEAGRRQLVYARELPARTIHLVKARPSDPATREIDPLLSVKSVPVRHWVEFFFRAVVAADAVLRTEQLDIIQVQDPYLCGPVGAWLAWRHRLPLVVGAFSDEIENPVWLAERPLNRVANLVGKWTLRRASAVRADSEQVADRLRLLTDSVFYVPFLIMNDQELAQPAVEAPAVRRELLGGRAGPLLLAVTRLEPEKNVAMMIEAVASVSRQLTGVTLTIAGDGTQRASLRNLAEAKLPSAVRFLGWADSSRLPALYQAADLTLLSSDRESAARVLTETLLAGTPVVTTNTAGAREVVTDGVDGRIVPVGDARAFASAILDLCSGRTDLHQMGLTASGRMSKSYSSAVVIDGLRAVYAAARGIN